MTNLSPEYHSHEEFQNRSRKLKEIRAAGIDPYPAKYLPTESIQIILHKADPKQLGHYDDAAAGATSFFTVSGRIVLFRSMGKNIFAHIQDEGGRLQILFNKEHTKLTGFQETDELSAFKFLEKKLDLGDYIGIQGYLFKTQKGEVTLFAKQVTLLAKALLPLPEKHSGLADKEIRYRKRWLDLISSPDSLNTFRMRSKILVCIRNYFTKAGFEEVETPILQNIYGGASARPFTTHLHALHQDMFLRIALEISLKKLIVGGMEKVFEIGKIFRNEGLDRTHNPEFTMLEAYAAGWDYNDMMNFTEKLFETIALTLFGTTELVMPQEEGSEVVIELKAPWRRLSMKGAVLEYGGLDVDRLSTQEMKEALLKLETLPANHIQKASRGALIAMLFEELAEKQLIQPHHIIDHPIETTPLCKLHRDPQLRQEGFVERFESFILGREICNSYSELNDPELQRELLVEQAQKREGGDLEASPLDEDFLEAICQGMPPTGGVGIGIDRLVMIFTKAASIRDVLFFPIMRS